MPDLSGKTLGPYTIKKKLGQGGMGSVYLAHQSTMDRDVAIKVLPVVLAQDLSYLERFRREAKLIAKLEHARILPVHDYGEQDGISYIVMRYLKAGTLAERIRSGKIPLPEIVHIMTQVAQGLDYAHTKGVIHRDVKPANIMLDHNGDVYVTDFGLSRLIEDSAHLTGSAIMGTPEYIAPEQGMDGEVDHRVDIYSLGVVLYEMLTGKVPFTGKSSMVVIVKHINEASPNPIKIAPDISPAVSDVVMKATAKDPNERYQSCKELVDALSVAASGAIKASPRRNASLSPRSIVQALAGAIAILVVTLIAPLFGPLVASFAPAPTVTSVPTSPPDATVAVQPPTPQATLSVEDMTPILDVQTDLMECAGSMRPVIAYDIGASPLDGQFVFAGTASGVKVDGGKFVVDPMGVEVSGKPLRVGPPLSDTDVVLKVAWTSGLGGLRLYIRSDPAGAHSYSVGIDPRNNIYALHVEEDVKVDTPLSASLFDGQIHSLRLTMVGSELRFAVDEVTVLTYHDTTQLRPGIVLLHVINAPIELDMIAVCGTP